MTLFQHRQIINRPDSKVANRNKLDDKVANRSKLDGKVANCSKPDGKVANRSKIRKLDMKTFRILAS